MEDAAPFVFALICVYALSISQEKEVYRFPVKESLKSMLAMGWNIDRTKEGEAMFQQRENEKMRKISQASQANVSSSWLACLLAYNFVTSLVGIMSTDHGPDAEYWTSLTGKIFACNLFAATSLSWIIVLCHKHT